MLFFEMMELKIPFLLYMYKGISEQVQIDLECGEVFLQYTVWKMCKWRVIIASSFVQTCFAKPKVINYVFLWLQQLLLKYLTENLSS